MDNQITRWHAELRKGENRCVIYNKKEEIVDDIKASDGDKLIDLMRESIVRNIKIEHGENAGHELSQSTVVGDGIYDIPITIVDQKAPVIGGKKVKTPTKKKEDTNVSKNTNVSFTPIAPNREGYYFYSPDGTNNKLCILLVSLQEDEFVVYKATATGAFPIDDYDTEDSLWSKNPVAMPTVDANNEQPVVDHEDW